MKKAAIGVPKKQYPIQPLIFSPLMDNTLAIGRDKEIDMLVEDILNLDSSCFLIAGLRGVGKTTFVNLAISKLIGDSKDFLIIRIDVARYLENPMQLLRRIIRALYETIKSEDVWKEINPELQEKITLAYLRSISDVRETIQQGITNTMKEEAEENIFIKDIKFLGYDDEIAEWELKSLIQELVNTKKLKKIIFVIDETDKSNIEDSKKTLNSLKSLFLIPGVSFIFIGPKEFYRDLVYSKRIGMDIPLDSIFTRVIHVKRLTDSELEEFFKKLIKCEIDEHLSKFRDYLICIANGSPRDFIREIRAFSNWSDDGMIIDLSKLSDYHKKRIDNLSQLPIIVREVCSKYHEEKEDAEALLKLLFNEFLRIKNDITVESINEFEIIKEFSALISDLDSIIADFISKLLESEILTEDEKGTYSVAGIKKTEKKDKKETLPIEVHGDMSGIISGRDIPVDEPSYPATGIFGTSSSIISSNYPVYISKPIQRCPKCGNQLDPISNKCSNCDDSYDSSIW